MNMKRTLKPILLVVIFSVLSCKEKSPVPAVQVQNSPATATVHLASSKNLWATLPIVAINHGQFASEKLEVRVEFVQAAKFAMDALVGSSTDFATVVETNISFLGFTGNRDIAVVATICESDDSGIVFRKSAGIAQPSDLKGKRLGLLPGTTSQIFADRFLSKYGLSLSDVQVTNLQAPAMQAAFVEKGVDAISIWEPFVTNISKAGGDDAAVFKEPRVYVGLMNVAIRKSWASDHRSEVVRFIRALRKAEEWVRANPKEAQALMAKELNLNPELVARIWSQYTFAVDLDEAQLEKAIAEEGAWIQKTQPGFADKALPDYAGSKYTDTTFLSEAK